MQTSYVLSSYFCLLEYYITGGKPFWLQSTLQWKLGLKSYCYFVKISTNIKRRVLEHHLVSPMFERCSVVHPLEENMKQKREHEGGKAKEAQICTLSHVYRSFSLPGSVFSWLVFCGNFKIHLLLQKISWLHHPLPSQLSFGSGEWGNNYFK